MTTLTIVFDTESEDGPHLVGTLVGTYEDVVNYMDTDGLIHNAPHDCVTTVQVKVPDPTEHKQQQSSKLYEELRNLKMQELYDRAGIMSPKGKPTGAVPSWGRQSLIAHIITRETQ